jgi:hypothetical protein
MPAAPTSFYIKIIIVISLFFFATPTFAQELPTITVVNPLRGHQLGLEGSNLKESLVGQWNATKESSISATWLWQYSALEEKDLTQFAKSEMKLQEHGIFLEIDKNFAEKSGIEYKARGPWYHSEGLLLTSYDKFERYKLIDTVFKKFKNTFGYYPKSVGAWWVGAEPIHYMEKKYGITAVLQCADQFNTDAYSIWGTPWSIPYIPSKINAAIPAQDKFDSLAVAMMQWAPRDPLKAYGDSVEDSTFSTQDYQMKGYNLHYFEYLKNIYLKNKNDQYVFGLEGGLPSDAYLGQYKNQIIQSKKWQNENKIKIQSMRQFSTQFLKTDKSLPPTNYFLTKDYNSNDQSFWYHSALYRIGIHKVGNEISVVDIRDYSQNGR